MFSDKTLYINNALHPLELETLRSFEGGREGGKKFHHLYWSDFLHGENKRYNIPSSEIRMSHGKIYNLACDHKFLDPP